MTSPTDSPTPPEPVDDAAGSASGRTPAHAAAPVDGAAPAGQAQGAAATEAAIAGAAGAGTLGPWAATRAPKWLSRLFHQQHEGEEEEDPEVPDSVKELFTIRPVRLGFGLAIGVALALMLWLALASLSQLLMWIAVALFIALGLDPIVRFFERRNWPRPAGVAIVVVLLLGAIGAFLGTLIPALIAQITTLVRNAPAIVDSLTNNPTIQAWDTQFHLVEQAQQQLEKILKDSSAVGGVFTGVIGAGNLVGQFAFGALIVLVLAIYFLVSLPAMKRFAYSLAPRSKRRRARELGEEITRSVGNYVMGQATVAVCNAIIAFILMTIFKVPYPALLALCVAVLAFIPLVGGVFAGLLVIVVALFSGGWQVALFYAICYFAYLQVEAYFVSPKIMARAVKVPGAVAVIAVIAGGTLLGVAGALMAIPIAASVMLLVREVWIKRQDAR
ncbi:AI-2E family transporter [Galactobacter valiniphilus]|uniref:AI-2E family transporter n=1 Tax=Galactobacter valiniphilus TaxID=2676122 RepID=A0A399JEZ2_9MICC|nr:AI-2E family transporter [Galactobacter valiniphilus]RII42739.1 AI-2E family transporter [Galactobacter valiniphilus]